MVKLTQVRELVESHDQTRKDFAGIAEVLSTILTESNPTEGLLGFMSDLTKIYRPKVRRHRNVFNLAEKHAASIQEAEKDSYERVRQVIRRIRTSDWNGYLSKLSELKLDRRIKEYFLRVRFYTELDRNTGPLRDLEELGEFGSSRIIRDKFSINSRICKKYRTMLGDNGSKMFYYRGGPVLLIQDYELYKAFDLVSMDKAVSWDLIPGKSISSLKNKNNYLEIIIKLTNVLNEILRMDILPEQLVTARLFCLNKDSSNHGDVDNLRPIAISSTFLKLIETVIYDRLSGIVYSRKFISRKQTGFMREA